MTRFLVAAVLFASLVACSEVASTDLRTSGMYATISGTAAGSGPTTVSTTLQLGPLSTSFVDLTTTDSLTATSGTDTATLVKSNFLGLISYGASLSGDEEGKKITVALKRGAMDTGAPNSVITLPAKFQLTGPRPDAPFKRGSDAISVSWDNSGKADLMSVLLEGACIKTVSKDAQGDSGNLVIAGTDVIAAKGSETASCDVNVTVRRARAGTLDPAYGKGGTVTGYQERRVSVKSTP